MKLLHTNSPLVIGDAWKGAVDASAKIDLHDSPRSTPFDPVVRVYGKDTAEAKIRGQQVAMAINSYADMREVLLEIKRLANAFDETPAGRFAKVYRLADEAIQKCRI